MNGLETRNSPAGSLIIPTSLYIFLGEMERTARPKLLTKDQISGLDKRCRPVSRYPNGFPAAPDGQ
jgi:hypothetical protein